MHNYFWGFRFFGTPCLTALHRHRKGVGSNPAREPIVDEFFTNVPGWFFKMCMIPFELNVRILKAHSDSHSMSGGSF